MSDFNEDPQGEKPQPLDDPTKYTVTRVVDGATKEVTVAELLKEHQKGESADRKFREASEMRRENEMDIQIANDLKKGFADKDPAPLRRAFRAIGLTEDEVEQFIYGDQGSEETHPPQGKSDPSEDEEDDPRLTRALQVIENLSKEVDGLKQESTNTRVSKQKAVVRSQVYAHLDSDPEIATIMESLGEEHDWFRTQAMAAVRRRADEIPWGSNGERPTRAAIEDLKKTQWYKKLKASAVDTSDDDEDTIPGDLSGLGLSSAPAPSHLHRPGAKDDKSIYSDRASASIVTDLRRHMRRSK